MGEIETYIRKHAPKELRDAVLKHPKKTLDPAYPYDKALSGKAYEAEIGKLHIELVKLQAWVRKTGARVAIVFEGRDAAGKGGTIKRFREHMNPRAARVAALPTPSDYERGQWYFQRYIQHLPGPGELVFFDRSWYNRAVVERVFGFSTDAERELFYHQVPEFEDMLVNDGILLFKLWLTVGRAEQMRRFLDRERDPLKQWKLSPIDFQSLDRWKDYSLAIEEMFARTNFAYAPWTVIRADDKKRARIAAIRSVLSAIPYDKRSGNAAAPPDPAICGPAEKMPLASP